MLKKFRVGISLLFFTLITFYFLDFRGILPDHFHALAHIQFIPALLAANFGILIVLLLLTLFFGRIYCSSICPMGVFQDIISWFSKRAAKKKRKRYKYSKAKTALRWSVLGITVVFFLLSLTILLGVVDPYSAYGRMATHLFKPVYLAGNNLLAYIFSSFGNYSFYKVDIFIFSISAFVIAVVTFFGIGFLAWKYGRTYCNTICPVGTILGFLSKYAFFQPRINAVKCTRCGVCESKCKALCINAKEKTIDYTRCVDCFNCIGSCKFDALSYTSRSKVFEKTEEAQEETIDKGKRKFLLAGISTVLAAPAALARGKERRMTGRKVHTRQTPISPPGAISNEHLLRHCTSCHLCVSKCPTNILKPAFMEYGLGGMMQPMMFFEKGYCNYDCTICSNVCPNGALRPLTTERKHSTQTGHVVFNRDICVVITEGNNCGACAEHCPTQAVKMMPYRDGLTIPTIDTDICVGCGGCEFICPVRPHRAIYVEGNEVHKEAKPFEKGVQQEIEIDGFGF